MPNTFAYIALFGWPLVCIGLFAMLRVEQAAIWSILAGYLLLPSNMSVDVPLLPPIDKIMITSLSAFLLCWMKGTREKAQHPSPMIWLLAAAYVLSPILTSFGNSYELENGAVSLHGFYPLDGLKFAGRQLIALFPLFIGIRFLSNDYGRTLLLKSLPLAFIFYSFGMWFELRMSPQLHSMVYGYFPHEFAQMVRDGGYRPVVFLEHGLVVALLTSMSMIAALIGVRARWKYLRIPAAPLAGYFGVLLVLCKSMGPMIYGVVFAPVVLFTKPKLWTKLACAMLLLVCFYPALRTYGLSPVDQVKNLASAFSTARASSFNTRVTNEDELLAKANEKPLFGWGMWGRNRVYDPATGRDMSITDGGWILQFGYFGWWGYLSLFGLVTLSAFRAARAVGDKVTPSSVTLGGLTLLLGIYVVDQIPNASTMALTFLLAGSIAGSPRRVTKAASRRPQPTGELSQAPAV